MGAARHAEQLLAEATDPLTALIDQLSSQLADLDASVVTRDEFGGLTASRLTIVDSDGTMLASYGPDLLLLDPSGVVRFALMPTGPGEDNDEATLWVAGPDGTVRAALTASDVWASLVLGTSGEGRFEMVGSPFVRRLVMTNAGGNLEASIISTPELGAAMLLIDGDGGTRWAIIP